MAAPAAILLVLVVVAIFAPLLAPQDPFQFNTADRLQGPSRSHVLGTDEYGRDLLSRLIVGSRSSLVVAVASVALASLSGIVLGVIAGYFGGVWEAVTMRGVDLVLAVPPIVLAISVVAFLGPSLVNSIGVIAVLYMAPFARLTFASVKQIKEREFVAASRVLGVGTSRLIRTAVLPNIVAPILVQVSLCLGFAILLEAGLSFLGLGVPPPEPSWGNMVGAGRNFMQQNAWYLFWPSLAISVMILCCNMLGDGLRDALDPRVG